MKDDTKKDDNGRWVLHFLFICMGIIFVIALAMGNGPGRAAFEGFAFLMTALALLVGGFVVLAILAPLFKKKPEEPEAEKVEPRSKIKDPEDFPWDDLA